MVQADGVQPGEKTFRDIEAGKRPEGLLEYLLNRILRLITPSEQSVGQGVKEGGVAFYDCLESRRISVQGSLHRPEILGILVLVTLRCQTISPPALNLLETIYAETDR